MELQDREFFVYRICSGYVKYRKEDIVLYTNNPTIEELYKAQECWLESYEDALSLGMYPREELIGVLKKTGVFTDEDEAKIEGLPKEIENLKVKMFQNLMRSSTRENLRKHLRLAEKQLKETMEKKLEHDIVTCEGYSSFSRGCWLVDNCTRLENGSKFDWSCVNFLMVMSNYYNTQPTEKEIRELAKQDPFRTHWGASKEKIFKNYGMELTDSQLGLILWSKLYDGIHENPDCPSDDVIQDDDLLDGWLIYDRRKRETEKNKNSAEQHDMDADEIFIPIETSEDQSRVDSLNDPTSQMVVKQRHNQIQETGAIKHGELNDVKRDLQVQANEQYKNQVRG
jgi:hypothetical protein